MRQEGSPSAFNFAGAVLAIPLPAVPDRIRRPRRLERIPRRPPARGVIDLDIGKLDQTVKGANVSKNNWSRWKSGCLDAE